MLMNLGLKLEDVREEVLNLLGHGLEGAEVGERGGRSGDSESSGSSQRQERQKQNACARIASVVT